MSSKNKSTPTQKASFKWLKRIGKILLVLFILFVALVLFIRSEWGQSIIVDKAISYLEEKTQTEIAIEKLYLTFDGDLLLKDLYVEDRQGDTLIFSKTLEADIPLLATIRGEAYGVESIEWDGLVAKIYRKDTISGFNYQFIADAFASNPTDPSATDTDQSSQKAPEIIFGEATLSDFDIVFNDAVSGIESSYQLKEAVIDVDSFSLEDMRFSIAETEINGAQIRYVQGSPQFESQDETPLPYLAIDDVTVNNSYVFYASEEAGLEVALDLVDFTASEGVTDLENQQIIVAQAALSNSAIKVLATDTVSDTDTTAVSENILASYFPDYEIEVATADISNSKFQYDVGSSKSITSGELDPNHIQLLEIDASISDFLMKYAYLQVQANSLSLREASGLELSQLIGAYTITNEELEARDFSLVLNQNTIKGTLEITYPTFQALIEQPELVKAFMDIPTINLALNRIPLINPLIRENPILDSLSRKRIRAALTATGSFADLRIENADAQWGTNTQIAFTGNLKNITNVDQFYFDLNQIDARSTKKDLSAFLPTLSTQGINLPTTITVAGDASGTLTDLQTNLVASSSQGRLILDGALQYGTRIDFDIDSKIVQYDLGTLMSNPQLGNLSARIQAEGTGSSLNTLDARVTATIDSLDLQNYQIEDLSLKSVISNGEGTITSRYKDQNINAALDATVVLDSIRPSVDFSLDVTGVDLQALGLMQRDVRTGFKLNGQFEGNSNAYALKGDIEDGVVVYDDRSYLVGNFDFAAFVKEDSTSVRVQNRIVDLTLNSNATPQAFTDAITTHIQSYFYRDVQLRAHTADSIEVQLKGRIAEAPVLNDVFLVNLKDLDTITFAVDYNELNRSLEAQLNAPHLQYSGVEVDSLAFTLDSKQDEFKFDLGFNNIVAGPLDIQKTSIKGDQIDNQLQLDFLSYHNQEPLIHIASTVSGSRDSLVVHIDEKNLLFNKHQWTTPATNKAIITSDRLTFKDFNFKRNEQTFTITDQVPGADKPNVALIFKNYRLSELLNYLNPEDEFADGTVNGRFVIEEPYQDIGVVADIEVTNLEVLKTNLGTMAIDAQRITDDSYDFTMDLAGGVTDIDLTGDYLASREGADFTMDLKINAFDVAALETLGMGLIKESDGNLTGSFTMNGQLTDLQYTGFVNFENTAITATAINTPFRLEDERIELENERLSLNTFEIRDVNGNILTLAGTVGTTSLVNPTFDLSAKATDFRVLNAKEGDNDMVFGNASVDVDATIKGDLQIPIVKGSLTVANSTDLTYILPSATVSLQKRDGIVVFVNKENPDAILTRQDEETTTLTGYDVNALLKIDKGAVVNVLINEQTGDYLQIQGAADLRYKMSPNGKINLSGTYTVADGHYQMNLYNIVSRKFNLAPGSTVRWTGDPFNAQLDIRAIYDVESSVSSLMAPQISSLDPSLKGRYRDELPFYVYLNIDDELLQPQISFALDMPEDAQNALGGEVYGRIQQLNEQPRDLNKQVFSLLVFNRFYPDPGGDGSTGGVSTIARNNLNDALSDQLNVFSDKLLGDTGVQLDFGLDTSTDNRGDTPNTRTQLDIAAQKQLLNDRLTVSVGSSVNVEGSAADGESTPVIGNVSLEYQLTEDGHYILKGFRRNQFENVIDGQTIVSGIALIFTQEFNKFSQLWEAILRKESEDSETNSKQVNDNE